MPQSRQRLERVYDGETVTRLEPKEWDEAEVE